VMIAMAESVEGAGSYDLVSYSGTSTASATYTGGVYLVTFAISPA